MESSNLSNSSYVIPSMLKSSSISIPIIAILYILLFKVSFLLTIFPSGASPIFLPAGLALASVLILGRKALIGVGIGALYSNIVLKTGLANVDKTLILTDLIITISILIATAVSAIIVNQFCNKEYPLSKGKYVLSLLILGSVTYSTITSLIGVNCMGLYNLIPEAQFWDTFRTWWLGDTIGIILITPLLLSAFFKEPFDNVNLNFFELSLYLLATLLLCLGVFFQYNDLKYLILPLLFWSAYRFGIRITMLLIIIISMLAVFTTVKGIGSFYKENINDSILYLDLFLGVISICSLFLTGIISERKKTEDLIKTSQNNLLKNQILLESTIESPKNVSIYSIGRNYEYLSFNSQHSLNIKTMYGIEITLGMKLQDCITNKNELERAVTILNKAFLGESITTVRNFEFNNSYWEFRISPIVNQNDKIIGATVISTDITEIKKAASALKESEEKYRNIFENIQDVIFQTDPDGIFINISPSVETITGFTPEELIGKSTRILQINKNEPDTLIELINEVFIIKNYEKSLKTKYGETICANLNAKMIFDKNGKPHHIDAIAQDITQRKEDEKEIANQNNKLQIQNKELEQFAYITSHDLQEPLITLKCFSELIKADFPKDTNEDIKQYLDFILESSNRMQTLVKGLLDYSRIGNQIEIEKVNCNELTKEVLSSLKDTIEKTNCQITVENLPELKGLAAELIQLFQNLINNSIKFRKKEIQLTIHISAKQVNDDWQFTIKDNGIGIKEHDLEKAFVIFKRLNNRDEYTGIGIGLSICKKIVALHGGDIWIESIFGEGTTIHFTISNQKN